MVEPVSNNGTSSIEDVNQNDAEVASDDFTVAVNQETSTSLNPEVAQPIDLDLGRAGASLANSVLNFGAFALQSPALFANKGALDGVEKTKEAGAKNTEKGEVAYNPPVNMNFVPGTLSENSAKAIINSVLSFPPKGDHALNWKGDKDKLQNTQSTVVFANSRDPNSIVSTTGGLSAGGDAITAIAGDTQGSKMVMTEIYTDKITNDEKGQPRSKEEITARLAVALAHEMYGNQTFNLKAIQDGKDVTKLSRKESELASFQAGVDYIDRFMDSPSYQQASPALQKAFVEAREREVQGLESWKKAPDNNKIPSTITS